MSSEELENCPFCGGEAEVFQDNIFGTGWILNHHEDCVVDTAKPFEKKEDAIKAWNTRATTKREQELVEALEDAQSAIIGFLVFYAGDEKSNKTAHEEGRRAWNKILAALKAAKGE